MQADERFRKQPKNFWANVRTISEALGYTARGKKLIRIPTLNEVRKALGKLTLTTDHLVRGSSRLTSFGKTLFDYFAYRAEVLNDYVQPRLMDAERARAEFLKLKAKGLPTCPLPVNKQKGAMKAEAYLTCMVNMLIEANRDGFDCEYDPRQLTTITKAKAPLRTLARRVDGAFPTVINPIAVWEIKEYYYTTTFGSRVADGVYESLLDGMELEELREHEKINVLHYLMIDAHYTWWECGKSYLCRIIDMLHMGYVDEVLFGYEVVERLPAIVKGWVKLADADKRERSH